MKQSFAEQLILYQSNVLPSLLEKLSQQLHISAGALNALGIGYALHNNCWVFPERDEYGNIIGLSLRQWNGKKYMVAGSQRGLVYVPNIHQDATNSKGYVSGPQNWTRTSTEILCPICGKPDWCMVSAERPDDPKAVLCCRVQKGAVKCLSEAGYLHIRKPEGELTQAGAVLLPSERPLLIVEGATDVAAAIDVGFVAVGRPSSVGCLDKLTHLVASRNVVVLGENDAGAGKEGMEKAFEVLRPHAKHTVQLLPPDGIKDLRQWVTQGLTQESLLDFINTTGSSTSNEAILSSIAPLDLAKQWLEAIYFQDDIYTLRVFHGSWYAYNGRSYKEIETANLRQQLYRFFYEPTKQKLDQIMDALLAYCPITSEEFPCWLDQNHKANDPRHILVFPNGYLDINNYTTDGDFKLEKPTPHFFSLACYPYNFNPNATCVLWKKFLREVFADDPLKIVLLQEWFGYNLIPDNSQEKFLMLLGPTRAGKGTILDVLTYILGEDQVLATSFRDYTRRFAMFPFLGKLAAVIGDVSVGTNYDATEALNFLKRITGNDAIMIERKGRDITQTCIKLYARFTMAANVMPRLPDFSRTIESRMLVIKFLTSFIGREDITLKARLRIEAPGILVWALEGLKRLQKNKDFTLPATHHQVLQRIRREITPVIEFIDECCSLGEGPEYYILTDDLFACWQQWAIRNGEKSYTVRWLNRSLLSLFSGCKSSRRLVNQRRKGLLLGLKLRPEIIRDMGIK